MDTCSGTIVAIVDPGGPCAEWRAMVREADSERPTLVRSRVAPFDLRAGDDVSMAGVRSPCRTRLASCEFRVDAATRWRDVGDVPVGLVTRRGVPGGFASVCARDRVEPDIAWAVERFGAIEIPSVRGSVVVFQPSSLLGADRGLLAESLPRVGFRHGVEEVARHATETIPSCHRMGRATVGIESEMERAGHFVVPYSPMECGLQHWRGISGLRRGFMPRAIASPGSRHRFTIAHELAHAFADDFRTSEPATVAVREGFADAVGLIVHVLDAGDDRDARLVASMRSLAVLEGDPYMTGASCVAAIDEAGRLRLAHGGRAVPIEAVLFASERIARANAITDPKGVHDALEALRNRDWDWRARPPDRIRQMILEAADGLPARTPDRPMAVRLMALAASAIVDSCYTPHEMLGRQAFRKAMEVVARDLNESAGHLSGNGMSSGVEILVARAREESDRRAWRGANAVTPRDARILDEFGRAIRPRNSIRPRDRAPNVDFSRRPGAGRRLVRTAARLFDTLTVGLMRPFDASLQGVVAERRVAAVYDRMLSDLQPAHGSTVRREAFVSLDLASPPSRAHGIPAADRWSELARMTGLADRMLRSALSTPAGPSDAVLVRMNRVRRRAKDIALFLCLDSDCIRRPSGPSGEDAPDPEEVAAWRNLNRDALAACRGVTVSP